MSSQDRPEATAAASAPAREPETRANEPRNSSSSGEGSASPTHASGSAPTGSDSAITQLGGGNRRHSRRRHRSERGERGERGARSEPPAQTVQSASSRSTQSERELNLDELRELSDLIDAHNFTEFEIEREGFRLRISKNTLPQFPPHTGAQAFVPPTVTPVAPPTGPTQTAGALPATTTEHAPTQALTTEAQPAPTAEELHKITSPIVGTFYRAASPTAAPFAEIGSRVSPETVVCIIEAMKLMNEIQADISGTVEEIYVENGQPVEFGQALFGIKK